MQVAVLPTTQLCRVHRVGQTRSVTTIRYLVRDSFEEVNPSESAQNPSCKILTTLKQIVNISRGKEDAGASDICSRSLVREWHWYRNTTGML